MQQPRELSPLAILLGVIIGILFGAANAYIGLKVGMTVAASIPAAVISMGILRGVLKRGSLLENNMVQTIGSTAESLAAGMIFTIPALFIFAATAETQQDKDILTPGFWEMSLWGAIGGLLGVFFMVPLRRMLIVKEHGKLPYPEGLACAEVLESGERGGAGAKVVFMGVGVGAIYEFFRGLGFWAETAVQRLPLVRTQFALAAEPALLGVGYILGVRVAGFMLSGAVLGWFVIIPAIAFFGQDVNHAIAPATTLIRDMDPQTLWSKYLRFVGAGAVVLGGVIALLKSFGTIGGSILGVFGGGGGRTGDRTDRDIPTWVLILGVVGLAAAMYYLPQVHTRDLIVIGSVIVFGFFFVTVSSRLVGIVGSSSNPVSGMTIATLLGTALIAVYAGGMTGADAKFKIISVGALVCMAAAIAGDCSQDLKTGFLVKATPWKQQVGEMIGVLTATAAMAGVILLINSTSGFVKDAAHPDAVLAPQANLMKLLVQGVVDKELPWALVLMGIAGALTVELLGIPSLPVAIGLYLPLSLSTPIMVGGVIRWLIDRRRRQVSEGENPGVLGASGLVAGQGLMGVSLIIVTALIAWLGNDPRFTPPGKTDAEPVVPRHLVPWLSYKTGMDPEQGQYGIRPTETGVFTGDYALDWYNWLPFIPFGMLAVWLAWTAMRSMPGGTEPPPGVAVQGVRGPEPPVGMPAPPPERETIPLIEPDETPPSGAPPPPSPSHRWKETPPETSAPPERPEDDSGLR